MAKGEEKKKTLPMNAIRICIDRYGDDISGRIYSRMSAVPLTFAHCGELLLRTDGLFDECGFPQNFEEKRTFVKDGKWTGRYARPKEVLRESEIQRQQGKCLTLDVIIWSRQKAGWQGVLLYPDDKKASEFKSELELLEYIYRVLQKKQTE